MIRPLKIYLLVGLLAGLSACARAGSQSPAPQATEGPAGQGGQGGLALTHGSVIDGTGAEALSDGMVIIRDGRIALVGPTDAALIPSGATILDVEGATILPGIINAHVHETASPAVRSEYFLQKGVTSTCDLGAPYASMKQFTYDSLSGDAARGFRSGPIISVPGGYPQPVYGSQISYPVSSVEEARAAVANLVKRGADVIKIALEPGFGGYSWPMLSLEQVEAIVEEAHTRGKLVRAHVTTPEALETALEAGVDVLEHVPVPALSAEDWELALRDKEIFQFPAAYEAQLARMVEQDVILVPTLSVTPRLYDLLEVHPDYKDQTEKLVVEPVRRFHSLGGVIALGNDYPNPGAESGMPLKEMEWLIKAGLSPLEVIQAATQPAAYVCGHGDELGTLEVGKLADLLVVDGDPLAEIAALSRVVTVIKDGKIAFTQD